MNWQTSEQLRKLICQLVSWESETCSVGEQQFPLKLEKELQRLRYFEKHPEYLELIQVDEERRLISAFYKRSDAAKTVVLISHFDTVSTEEYGALQPFATNPVQLTEKFRQQPHLLNESAQKDLFSGDYLFGRGVMDMKMGLALHMHLLEKASEEEWLINLLLISVPDEEVNSAGMRVAVEHIAQLKEKEQLEIALHLNSEPSFSQDPTDLNEYFYTGTIGKIMPAALFYGKETHVGEPLKGMTASFLNSYLTAEMEWNEAFLEEAEGEYTPLPVALEQKDLKLLYSTQTPYRAFALYNVFLMRRSAEEIFTIFRQVAEQAMAKCQERYEDVCAQQHVTPIGKINVLSYEDVYAYSVKKHTQTVVDDIIEKVMNNEALDDRKKSITIADQLMIHNQELAPAAVLLFAPPFYPPASSKGEALIKELSTLLLEQAQALDIPLSQKHYFNGICDLSYCQNLSNNGWHAYEANTPVWQRSYTIPFEAMEAISAPVMNIGPFGKDAHQISERLHLKSALEEMPNILTMVIKKVTARVSSFDLNV
ncbi:MAG: M20/M25/M40 family metallo-hydrolase [Solibacillus sp.]